MFRTAWWLVIHGVFLSCKKIRENFDLKGPSHKNAFSWPKNFSSSSGPKEAITLLGLSLTPENTEKDVFYCLHIPPETDFCIEALIFVKKNYQCVESGLAKTCFLYDSSMVFAEKYRFLVSIH